MDPLTGWIPAVLLRNAIPVPDTHRQRLPHAPARGNDQRKKMGLSSSLPQNPLEPENLHGWANNLHIQIATEWVNESKDAMR